VTAGLALVGAWIGILALGTLVLLREVSLIRARVSLVGVRFADGPEVGTLAARELRGQGGGRKVALFLSSACPPCIELAAALGEEDGLDERLLVLIGGDEAEAVGELLPASLSRVTGQQASDVAARMGVRLQPMALAIERDLVVGKLYPAGVDELVAFTGAQR
jgi:hypothetical protein